MAKKYIVTLTPEEQQYLEQFSTTGRHAASHITHARILLKANTAQPDGSWCDEEIASALDVSVSTIERVRRHFVEAGLEAALKPRPGTGRKRQVTGAVEAHLIALRCNDPPTGQSGWTLRLLAERMVELDYVEQLSHETVRQVLKKTNSSSGSKRVG
jgi:transposase